MSQIEVVYQFFKLIRTVQTESDLFRLTEDITYEIGFQHFALINHVDFRRPPGNVIQIYNYPPTWTESFIQNGLYVHDPVLRASLTSTVGFAWSDIPTMIQITSKQRAILENAAKHGLGGGYTVPAHIPGEISGSCSFATKAGVEVPSANLWIAQAIGGFAFQATRRLSQINDPLRPQAPHLTPRQRDCLLWAIKGKTDWEIGQILGLNEHTVARHLNIARERYGVTKRLPLAIQAIFDGQISFIEALF
jgi:LuxR family quorum-sensing system transcriptional regulator CciR